MEFGQTHNGTSVDRLNAVIADFNMHREVLVEEAIMGMFEGTMPRRETIIRCFKWESHPTHDELYFEKELILTIRHPKINHTPEVGYTAGIEYYEHWRGES